MQHREVMARGAIVAGVFATAAAGPMLWVSGRDRAVGQAPAPVACGGKTPAKQGWTGGVVPPASAKAPHVFRLSDCYPETAPKEPTHAWERIDPRREPEAFLWAVLDYVYEGNLQPEVEDSFDMDRNLVRRWYNAPWLDVGGNSREGVHGLTRERTSCSQELAPTQSSLWDNYAVGYYNAKGGQVLRQVWGARGEPSTRKVLMPIGTVGAKLLFTTATEAEVPYLKGAPTWQAYVYDNVHNSTAVADSAGDRRLQPLRLLQVDLAVRSRYANSATGWVFGTFVYGGGGKSGDQKDGWRNLTPLGLMWGNNLSRREQWINPKLAGQHHLGWQGRLNGPVDNPNSSCLSCHGSAEQPLRAIAPKDKADAKNWFPNVKAGVPFRSGATSLDYSLQLAFGVENYRWVTAGEAEFQPPPFCPPWRATSMAARP